MLFLNTLRTMLLVATTSFVCSSMPTTAYAWGDVKTQASELALCLDVRGWGTSIGNEVAQWTCDGGSNQQPQPENAGDCPQNTVSAPYGDRCSDGYLEEKIPDEAESIQPNSRFG